MRVWKGRSDCRPHLLRPWGLKAILAGLSRRWCGMAHQTANRTRNASQYFATICRKPDLQIAPSAMYLLSSDSCPEEATSEAITLAKSGKRITHTQPAMPWKSPPSLRAYVGFAGRSRLHAALS